MSLDGPVMKFLSKVADMMILNLLVLFCSLPIITMGASLTAMHYVALRVVRNEESYITKDFFKSFKMNFKQATKMWLFMLLVGVLIGYDIFIMTSTVVNIPSAIKVIILVVTVILALTTSFAFPLLSKFDNTNVNIFKNSFAISIAKFPRAVIMVVVSLAPIAILFMPQYLPFFILFGFSVPAWICAILYNDVFKRLEEIVYEAEREANPEAFAVNPEDDDVCIFKDLPLEDEDQQ
jgi:uncharacterized membrane protein YesL